MRKAERQENYFISTKNMLYLFTLKPNKMRITLLLTLSLLLTNIYGQDTFSEFDKTNEGFEIEKIKNSDLQLIKEIYRDKSGKTVRFYNYNPTTGALDGDFDNGLYSGNYKNGLITSDNYIQFLNPSSDSKVLIIKGKIVAGKLNGAYNVTLRSYDTQAQYDHVSTVLNSYIRGEYTKTYSTYVNWTKFTDKVVGQMNFENGLYDSFDYIHENKQYKGKYNMGFLDYYIIKDLSNNRNIDSFKVAGKIYLRGGSFQKNKNSDLPLAGQQKTTLIDTLEKIKLLSDAGMNYKEIGLAEYSAHDYHTFQTIPIVDPLGLSFDFIKRKGYTNSDFINYIDNTYKKITFVPISNIIDSEHSNIGISSNNGGDYSIPAKFQLSGITKIKYDEIDILIPFFEHEFNLNRLVELYGTIKGYKILWDFYAGTNEGQLKLLNEYSSTNSQKQTSFSYADITKWNNRINQTLETWAIEKDLSDKKEAEKKKEEEIALLAKPQFPGGMGELIRFLNQNQVYPNKAKEEGRSGKSIVKFSVDENGGVSNLELEVSAPNCKECDEEALRVAKKMTKWIPGQIDGKKVPSTISIPFNFKLQ